MISRIFAADETRANKMGIALETDLSIYNSDANTCTRFFAVKYLQQFSASSGRNNRFQLMRFFHCSGAYLAFSLFVVFRFACNWCCNAEFFAPVCKPAAIGCGCFKNTIEHEQI